MTREEERELVRRVRQGDDAAFEDIVRAHEKIVYNLAYRTLGNREDAEDAAQETFMKAYAALPSFRGDSKLSGWLYQITGNVCIDLLRKRRDAVSLNRESDDGGETELELPDERFDPAVLAERRDLREQVGSALRQLPENYRQVLLLRELGGQSYEEIAGALRLDIGTVKSRIFRARKRLCILLAGNFSDEISSSRSEGGVQA